MKDWYRAIVGLVLGLLFGVGVSLFIAGMALAWGLGGFIAGIFILFCGAFGLAAGKGAL